MAIETPAIQQSRDRRQNLQANVDYAMDLGAEIVRGEATDLARGLAEWSATTASRTRARPRAPPRHRLGRATLADRLLDAVPGLEVHLVGEPAPTAGRPV